VARFARFFVATLLAAACSSSEDDADPTKKDSGSGSGGTAGAGGKSSSGGSAGSGGSSGTAASSTGGSVGTAGTSGGAGAGAGGGAGVDSGAGGSAGQTVDPCQTARFCEDFESYSTGNEPGGDWDARTNRGAVSVVEEQKFGGVKSAKFTTEANSGGKTAYIRLASAAVFPVPGNVYYGRMMFRLESAPEAAVHWTFIQSTGVIPGQSYRAVYRYGGQHPVTQGGNFVGNQLMANYDTPDSYSGNGPSSDCWHHADEKVAPVGRWACAEWQFDGPNDTLRFWLDGAALDDLTVQSTGQGCVHQSESYEWTAPNFEDLEVGWESYQGDEARTLFIDDIVISTTRIGCP
jgi:hypothetical protein